MKRGFETGKKENVQPIKKMVGPYAGLASKSRPVSGISLWYLVAVALLGIVIGMAAAIAIQVQFGLRIDDFKLKPA